MSVSNFDKISISRGQLRLGAGRGCGRRQEGVQMRHPFQALDDSQLEVKLQNYRHLCIYVKTGAAEKLNRGRVHATLPEHICRVLQGNVNG